MKQKERRLWLIERLLEEMPQYRDVEIPGDETGQRRLLRSLFNVRPPYPAAPDFLKVQDEYLSEVIRERGIVDSKVLTPTSADSRLYLWKGDITALRCDAIVNAANSALLGCWQPCHSCIDNIIHSFAGVQLRIACNEIMQAQGHEEATGTAKITPAFNLPCKYVLHTVGPIVRGRLMPLHCRQLASCYRSCLELADQNQVQSIAFCCISTGVFLFPNEEAAKIAVQTVKDYKAETGSQIKVIFNVFKELDEQIYRSLLGQAEAEKI